MTGMLIKDFKLLLGQKQFFCMIFVISLFFLTAGQDNYFVIMYGTLMFSMFTVSTMVYDENDNGAAYLFTLPVSRRGYVSEKYLFGFLTTFLSWLVFAGLSFGSAVYKAQAFDGRQFAVEAPVYFFLTLMIMALSIPVQLKFGAERSRIAMLILYGTLALLVYLAVQIPKWLQIDLEPLVNRMMETEAAGFLAGMAVLCAVATGIAWLVSVRVLSRKEF